MPRWLAQLRLRLRSILRPTQAEQELDDELQYHFERQIDAYLAEGLAPEAARWAARREMGPTARSLEQCRDARRVHVVEHVARDLRFALRQLAKSPAFAGTAVFVLALGLSASTAMFAFVDAALIEPLPYKAPSRLLDVYSTSPNGGRGQVSYLDWADWKRLNKAFASIDAYDVRNGFTLTGPNGPERVTGIKVTAGFFRTLGVGPALGRDFREDENLPSAPATAILGHGAWQARFGGRDDVLGQVVTLGGVPHTIVGVLPRHFHFAPAGPLEFATTMRGDNPCWQARGCDSLKTVARLADGVSTRAAVADMKSVAQQLERQFPDSNRDQTVDAVPLREVVVGDVRPLLLVLLSGASLLLLIAGINVSSLLLARADSRAREIAVRRALGASSLRLLLQFAVEAMALVSLSAGLAMLGAHWSTRLLAGLLTPQMAERMPYLRNAGASGRVVVFLVMAAAVAALVFTLVPAWRASRLTTLEGIGDASRGSAGRSWRRLGANLVIAELMVAVILLVSAGLLGKSLYRMLQVDVGFDADRLAVVSVGVPPNSKPEQWAALALAIDDRVAALPGVESVGLTDLMPLTSGGAWPPLTTHVTIEGRPEPGDGMQTVVRGISPGYFDALKTPMLRGRALSRSDTAGAPPVVVVNRTFMEQYFGAANPVGRRIVRGAPPSIEIVGVVADIREGSLEQPVRPAIYAPLAQRPNYFGLVARTSGSVEAIFPSLRAAVRSVDPALMTYGPMTMAERIERLPVAFLNRSAAWVVGGFATIALLLSVVGLYGVVSYSVGQRTREMGVRIALGAPGRSLYRLVLGEAGWLVGAGTLLGLVCAVAAATLMRRLLFGVQTWDVPTLAAVALVLVSAALVASAIPARRAASVNPIEVLRAD